MNRPNRSVLTVCLFAIAAGALGLGGCVRQNSYDEVYEVNRSLTARNQEQADKIKSLEAALEVARRDRQRTEINTSETGMTLGMLQQQNADLLARLKDYESRLAGLQLGPLDPATDAALNDLASKYADILSYDSTRGMLRFNSDLTFASGSYELTSQAKGLLDQVAKILSEMPSAQSYDVKIVGHTDSQPVTQRSGRPFKNNVELSAFRAISVREALVGDGLAANRVEFAGYGEYRPIVSNAANGNTPANRRVEIFIVRSTLMENALPMPDAVARRAAAAAKAAAPKGTTPAKPGETKPVEPAKPKASPNDDIMK